MSRLGRWAGLSDSSFPTMGEEGPTNQTGVVKVEQTGLAHEPLKSFCIKSFSQTKVHLYFLLRKDST